MSSRSRSPRISERRGREETADIPRVSWEDYQGQDPEFETIASAAKSVVLAAAPNARAAASAGDPPSRYYYVGVSRYLRERWYGGERIERTKAHRYNWERQHVLGHYSLDVGRWERQTIAFLKRDFGPHSAANVHPGGGGAAASKPNFLYICVLPRTPSHRADR